MDVLDLENRSHAWSHIMFSLPVGELSFMLCAGIDCLPIPVNLSRWKIPLDSSCPLRHYKLCTVYKVMNCCCPKALFQERYTWSHNYILACILSILRSNLPADATVYADLPGFRATDNPPFTVPPVLVQTTVRPDVVIASRQGDPTITRMHVRGNRLNRLYISLHWERLHSQHQHYWNWFPWPFWKVLQLYSTQSCYLTYQEDGSPTWCWLLAQLQYHTHTGVHHFSWTNLHHLEQHLFTTWLILYQNIIIFSITALYTTICYYCFCIAVIVIV